MTDFFKFLPLALFLSTNQVDPKNLEKFLPVHPSMVGLYESMVSGNDSTRDVIKILAIAGRVKSENPCRVKFKMPRKHRYSDVLKINLHLKVNTLETEMKTKILWR